MVQERSWYCGNIRCLTWFPVTLHVRLVTISHVGPGKIWTVMLCAPSLQITWYSLQGCDSIRIFKLCIEERSVSPYNKYTLQLHTQVTMAKSRFEVITMRMICSLIQHGFLSAFSIVEKWCYILRLDIWCVVSGDLCGECVIVDTDMRYQMWYLSVTSRNKWIKRQIDIINVASFEIVYNYPSKSYLGPHHQILTCSWLALSRRIVITIDHFQIWPLYSHRNRLSYANMIPTEI